MSQAQKPERTLHPLEGIVAGCALFLVLALTVGFAQAATDTRSKARAQKVMVTQGAGMQKVSFRSASVLVQDAETGEIVLTKNSDAIVPIASITKLMTAIVTLDRGVDLEESVMLSKEDGDRLKGTKSRLKTGAVLTRNELLMLALMASENRAAAALGRSYPEGREAFIAAMNQKAVELGMTATHS